MASGAAVACICCLLLATSVSCIRMKISNADRLSNASLGNVWTNCYCWNDATDPNTKHETRVEYYWVPVYEEGHKQCLERCGPKCKEQVGPLADEGLGSRYKFTCGDNPSTRKCGVYIVGKDFPYGKETLDLSPPNGCEGEERANSPKTAIFADYDGCWDIISGSNKGKGSASWFDDMIEKGLFPPSRDHSFVVGFLKKALTAITKDKEGTDISLFVGSNRQAVDIDNFNANKWNNGHALGEDGAFELWENYGIEGVPSVAGWKLEKTLIADNVWDGGRDGSAWTDGVKTFGALEDKRIKLLLAYNNIRFLTAKYGRNTPIDVYFFDDKRSYLNHVRYNIKLPPQVRLFVVYYDWMNYAQGLDEKKRPWHDPALEAISRTHSGGDTTHELV